MERRPPRQRSNQKPEPNEFFDALRQGTRALQQGKITEARRLLEQAHALDSDHPDAVLNLAGAYILSKQFKKAVKLLEPLSQQDADNPMVWTNLGAAYLGNPVLAGDAEQLQAIRAFKKAHALNPKAPHVAYNLGLIYRDRQENEDALHWFKRALDVNPHDKDARRYVEELESP